MRTRNEKILLLFLLVILFGGANFYGYEWISQRQHALEMSYLELKADRTEAEVDLQKQDLWTQRQAWIKAHEPVLTDEGDTKAKVLQYVLKGARDHDLKIAEENLDDVQRGAGGTRVNVGLKMKGSMQDICGWLTDLQKPDSFYTVSQLSLKADEDQKSMDCTLQLARYFKVGS